MKRGTADDSGVDGTKPITILYAEDDPVSSRVLGRTLQTLGYTFHGAANGQEALDWFLEHTPPILISDWMMPQLDGLQLCNRIRSLNLPHYTYFILLTANAGQANYHKAMDQGVDDFLAKPFRRDELYARIRVAERIVRQKWEADAKIRSLAHFPSDNPNPVLQVNQTGNIVYANQASMSLLQEVGAGLNTPLPDPLQPLLRSKLEAGTVAEAEMSCSRRVYSFAVTSVSEDGLTYLYGHDITARKRAETELIAMRNQAVAQSLQDALTGIGNRVLFQQRLPEMIAQNALDGTRMALVLVDIDNFKEINDSYGHRVGDEVIIHVGHTLRDNLKACDSVCRWGGDELVLMLSGLPADNEAIGEICDRLSRAVREGAATSDLPASITLSIGFAVYPDDAECGELLLQKADTALYKAKADGRNCWRHYHGTGKASGKGGPNLFQRLTLALEQEKLTAFFQPVWDVVAGRVCGVESLARWHDPELGFIPPDEFIPLAESKGLIVQLSRQVLRHSLQAMARWRNAGHDISLSVNLSKRQLVEKQFLNDLRRQVDELLLPHHRILFEVTERQSILGNSLGLQRLEEMAAEGFRLSLDDFGSGYSSFDMVGEIPFQELKICSGLVKRMDNPRGKGIVQAVVDMGHTLGLTVVAEGVEEEEQVRKLRAMGIHKIQGYFYSQPLSLDSLLSYLCQQAPPRPPGQSDPRAERESPRISY